MEKIKKLFSREVISYIICGLVTTLVNILLFKILFENCNVTYGIANIIAVVLAKVFAYFANKYFVFQHRCESKREVLAEMTKYIITRGFTGLIDIFGMFFAVEILHANQMTTKYILQVIVIVLNYLLGKNVVFKDSKIDRKTKKQLKKEILKC